MPKRSAPEVLGFGDPEVALVSGLACPDRGRPSFWSGKIFNRGQIAKSHVRTANIIVDPPGLDQPPRLGDRGEPVKAQALVAQRPVKCLDIGVIRRFPRTAEVDPNITVVSP